MGTQLIFCIEANKKTGTDSVYIAETIEKYYAKDNTISIKYIPLSGKNNYNKSGVIREIEQRRKQYTRVGNTIIIYCIDTDRHDMDSEQERLLREINSFCSGRGYELVLFCRDVEDVYWGKQVHSSEKVAMAAKFRSSGSIDNVQESLLRCNGAKRHSSNILEILDKHLKKR